MAEFKRIGELMEEALRNITESNLSDEVINKLLNREEEESDDKEEEND